MRNCTISPAAFVLIMAALITGCQTAPVKTAAADNAEPATEPAIMRQVMARKDKIINLSSANIDRDKPVLLLLHGATDDPTEMMKICAQSSGQYNVFLYSYNYHQPVETVALDLAREMRKLTVELGNVQPARGPVENVTVIAYSYSAIVFRAAVVLTDDRKQFSNVSLIQLVPTAGGSYKARLMGIPGAVLCVYAASKPSLAENPYGSLTKEIWDGEGNRKYYEAINPSKMFSILLEADSHSLADVPDKEVHQRYLNGIGENFVTIPKSAGVTHDYFPGNPIGLEYLRKILDQSHWQMNPVGRQLADPLPAQTLPIVALHPVAALAPGY